MRTLALLCALITAAPAFAQSDDAARAEALRKREASERRIEADMVQMESVEEALARNLGQLHFIRTLCFGDDDQMWRDKAATMMDLESKPDTSRRQALVKAFNDGYYHEKGRHAVCDTDVSFDAAAIAENGRHLAGMLADPYREYPQ